VKSASDIALAAILRAVGTGTPLPPAPAGAAWPGLAALAEARGVAAALGAAARRAAWPGVPAPVAASLAAALATGRARYTVFARELGAVLDAFAGAGVPALVLKGAALAEILYPDPALRPFADLDFLIRRRDLERADCALRAAGYARLADEHSWQYDAEWDAATVYERHGGARVDLHWALLSEPRCGWDAAAAETVWERAVDARLAGRAARTLGREDTLLHLAAHLAIHHALAGLPWVWDLALIVERWGPALDWAAVHARAGRWRVRTALAFALRGVEEQFGVVPPARPAQPRGVRAAALGALLRHASPARLIRLDPVVPLLVTDRPADVLRSLGRVVLPERAWLRARYGSEAASLPAQYLAHVRRLGRVAGTALSPGRRRSP
jgi:hypothetical protein